VSAAVTVKMPLSTAACSGGTPSLNHLNSIMDESAADVHPIGSFLLGHCANLRKVSSCALFHVRNSGRHYGPLTLLELTTAHVLIDYELQ
jgi:hypothetical protein